MHALTILAIALGVSGAKPAEPIKLNPAAPWKVDYSSSTCVLTRQFTDGLSPYDFQLTLAPIEKRAWMRIGSAEKSRQMDDGNASVEVDGTKLPNPTHFNIFPNSKGGTTREFLFEDFQRDVGHAAKTLRVIPARHGDFALDLADFPDAMRVMSTCMDDLYHALGVDLAVVASVATPPRGWPLEKVDLPRGGFNLTLFYWATAAGNVENCQVIKPTGNQKFDARVCQDIEKKARLIPARDSKGTAIRAPVYEDASLRIEERISTSPR